MQQLITCPSQWALKPKEIQKYISQLQNLTLDTTDVHWLVHVEVQYINKTSYSET